MVGYEEKQKLLRGFHNEPARGIGVVVKCAACLVIVAGISAMGVSADLRPEAGEVVAVKSAAAEQP